MKLATLVFVIICLTVSVATATSVKHGSVGNASRGTITLAWTVNKNSAITITNHHCTSAAVITTHVGSRIVRSTRISDSCKVIRFNGEAAVQQVTTYKVTSNGQSSTSEATTLAVPTKTGHIRVSYRRVA